MHSAPFNVGDLVELEIEKISYGGRGIARQKGIVIFVPFSAPGDLLRVKINEVKKNYLSAEIAEILRPGPGRITPPCPVYTKCGGCDLQHLSYDEQLKQKKDQVLNFLNKAGENPPELEIVPSPNQFHYRNRAQLKLQDGQLGFFSKKSHQIVPIEKCLIIEEELNFKIEKLRQDIKGKSSPELKTITLQSTNTNTESSDLPSSDGFSQVNTAQNKNLIQTILEWCSDYDFKYFYDLYAGSGNFTFPVLNSFKGKSIIAVELNQASVELAQNQIKKLNINKKSCRFYLGDVEFFLKRTPLEKESVVLIDPPRAGCSRNTIKYLCATPVSKILYISCDPAALARDIQLFKSDKPGLRVTRIKSFDMFPQTHHIETLVELTVDSSV